MNKDIERDALNGTQAHYLTKGLHTIEITGGKLEYFVHEDIKPNSVIPVFFHAALDRRKIVLPRFEGGGLCQKYSMTGLSFADPELYMYDMCSLAWFVGNDRYYNLQKEIHQFLEKIEKEYNLTFVFHGGSGGGFAALVQKSFFPNKHFAIVQNPQTNIFELSPAHTKNYFLTYQDKTITEDCFEETLKKHGFIYRIFSDAVTDVIYFQNVSDEKHVNLHLKPFLNQKFGICDSYLHQKKNNNYYFVGDWGQGHASLPAEKVGQLLQYVINNKSIAPMNEELAVINSLNLMDRDGLMNLFGSEPECVCEKETLWERITDALSAIFKKN